MIRDFSEEKKQELLLVIDKIDQVEWKSFYDFCGNEVYNLQSWIERLEIQRHIQKVDEYQEQIQELNVRTRNQLNRVFENVNMIDRKYAKELHQHSNKIREQIKIVQDINNLMRSKKNYSHIINYNKKLTNIKTVDAEQDNISINDFKEQITLYRRNSPNSLSYDEICTYLETLYQSDYICKADYENILSYLNSRNLVPTSVEKILYENTMKLLSERERIIEELSVQGWSREEIACALQVDILLTRAGFDEEYIMGVIGNVKCEGKYGIFEDPSYSPERMPEHLAHMITCVNYKEKYNGKNITEVDLMQVYYDLYCKSTECESDQHMFGLGSVQWTGDRTDGIIERYLKECGYDINTEEGRKALEIKLNEYKKALESNDFSNYDGVYINSTQVKRAETQYMVEELKGRYYSVYEDYNLQKGNDENQNIDTATELVMSDYESPSEEHANLEGRKEAAHTWYEVTRK